MRFKLPAEYLVDLVLRAPAARWAIPYDAEGRALRHEAAHRHGARTMAPLLPMLRARLRDAAVLVLDEEASALADEIARSGEESREVGDRIIQAARAPAPGVWIEWRGEQRLGVATVETVTGALVTEWEQWAGWHASVLFATPDPAAADRFQIGLEPFTIASLLDDATLEFHKSLAGEFRPPADRRLDRTGFKVFAALALINSRQVGIERKRPAFIGRTPTGRKVQYLAVRTLTITVPRMRARQQFDRHIARVAPRAHTVLGHWCERLHSGRTNCAHVFEPHADDADQYECMLCGRRRWWRRSFQRGDALKGFVVKRYNVTTEATA